MTIVMFLSFLVIIITPVFSVLTSKCKSSYMFHDVYVYVFECALRMLILLPDHLQKGDHLGIT